MRSLPPFLRGSREWQSAGSLARAVWQDVRPRRGDLAVHVPQGARAVDALASVLGGFGWDLRHAEVAAVLAEWERVGLCERAAAEGDVGGELLRVCSIPPTVAAELERLRRGPQGGMTQAEKQAAYRERLAAKRAGAVVGADGAVTGHGDRAEKGNNSGNKGDAPPAPPLSPGPPKGPQGEGGRAAGDGKRVEVPAEGRRSAEELAELDPLTLGALAMARLGKGVGPEIFDPSADRAQLRKLGEGVAELGRSEVDLLVVAKWLREVPAADVRAALSWSRSIRKGGVISVGFLICTAKDETRWAGLRAVLEVAVPWARKVVPGAFAPPVKATVAAGESGATGDTRVAR